MVFYYFGNVTQIAEVDTSPCCKWWRRRAVVGEVFFSVRSNPFYFPLTSQHTTKSVIW